MVGEVGQAVVVGQVADAAQGHVGRAKTTLRVNMWQTVGREEEEESMILGWKGAMCGTLCVFKRKVLLLREGKEVNGANKAGRVSVVPV